MTVYSVTGSDGQVHQFDADTQENAQKAFDWERMNSPAPTGSTMRIPLRAGDGSVQIYEAPSVGDAQKAMAWDQRQGQERVSGSTAPVSRAPGDWMGEAVDWLSKGPTTTAVRGVTGLVDAPDRAFDFPRTMISPPLAEQYRRAMATPRPDFLGAPVSGRSPGEKLGDAFFRQTGIPEYQAETPLGRTLMAGGEGGISGAPFGVGGALQGAIGGAASQAAGELAPEWPRVRALAGMAPSAGMGAYRYFNPEKPPLPVAGELKAIGGAQLNEARNSPVRVDRGTIQQIAADTKAGLTTHDLSDMAGGDWVVKNKIDMGGRDLNFNDLMNLKKSFQNVLDKHNQTDPKTGQFIGNPNEVAFANAMIRRIDQHIDDLPSNPSHVTAGTPDEVQDVVDTYRTGNANYGAGTRSTSITGGSRQTGTGGSIMGRAYNRDRGTNYSSALRSQVVNFMENDNNTFGFPAAELSALDRVKDGGPVRKTLRYAGDQLGGLTGLALGSALAAPSALASGGLSIIPYLIAGTPKAGSEVVKRIEANLARKEINDVARTTRAGSPEYQSRLANMTPDQVTTLRALAPGLLAPAPQPGSVVPGSEVLDPETGLLSPLPGSRTPRLPPGPSPDGRLYDWGDFRRLLGF